VINYFKQKKMDKPYNYRMTVSQVLKSCEKHRYLLLRYPDGRVIGINTKVAGLSKAKFKAHGNKKSEFISYRVISFQEYISCKSGFV
jgi:hypothetical protein